MSVAEFVAHLQTLDVQVSAEGERLRLNAPKGVLTDSLRAQIGERKQELLAFFRDKGALAASNPPPIVRRMDVNPAPLSFAQERLWFLEQLEPGITGYHICRAYRVTGELTYIALEASLNEIVRRHEVLRSAIRVVEGRPVQAIQPPFDLKLNVIDLRAMPKLEREEEIRRCIQQTAEASFDFAVGTFLRANLLRLSDVEHILILGTHHVAADAWSMGILTRKLWTLYETYAAGKSSQLEELPVQYGDFAVWQRDWLREEVLETQLSYWKSQLNDVSILNLPTDRARPARQSFRGARVPIMLPEPLSAAINDLSNRCGVTPFMFLLAAFQVLLYRYSGQEDIVVGSPIANRRRPELEPLIGFFVNTLVLRSDLSGTSSFTDLLLRVREVCLGAYAHQDLPFEKLVEELKPERDLSRNPLFQVMFALQNATKPLRQIGALRIEPMEIDGSRSQFDLSLFLREREGTYIGYIEYSTELFNRDRMERMVGHFQTLLEGIIANPEQSISTLPILTAAERQQILVEWNDTAADYPKDKCIHELFEEQVERTPDAIALEYQDQQISYRELNRKANQLAHYLISLGIGPEKLVGLCVERSLEMIIGLLGILKAGGAYVPLDPRYPKERLGFMLKDAQVSVLLTQDGFTKDRISKTEDSDPLSSILFPQRKIVCLDRNAAVIERQDTENPKIRTTSENLAYVIYTSGSTGHPKGVQVTHRSVVNCMCSIGKEIGLSHQDIWLTVTTISFDIAGLELYLPLIRGAMVVLASREETLDGTALSARLKSCDATVMQATPTTWNLLLDAGWKGPREVNILCGGEALSRQLANRLLASGASVWNLYGPTEATIWSTTHRVEPGNGPVDIGRPLANTQIYVLDAYMQPVPIGVRGDLYIGGDGLVRGYLNNPGLTSERFFRNPFSGDPDTRLYKTGDLARFRLGGDIEFLGRTDRQVKIRGYRIELEEIEAVLNQHPAVRHSVIIARTRDSLPDDSLVGYVVPRQQPASSISELREYLKDKLPDYMIPSVFMVMEEFPLMPNGKIDRSKLPVPKPSFNEAVVSPRTEIEELVAQVWRDVLKVDTIGVHDNFFELGGHSLLAIQIISRVRDILDKDVPLTSIFDAPTVGGLAARIEKTVAGRLNDLPPIRRAPRDGPVPLSMNQEHLWRLDQIVSGTHLFNMPYVYRLSGDLNVEVLQQAIKEIVRRHEVLRTVFSSTEGTPAQTINPHGNAHLSIVDLRFVNTESKSDEAAKLIVEERLQPFDLGKGPLLRTTLLQLTATESLFLLTLHHIIGDHSSVVRIKEELLSLYAAFCRNEESPLSEPQIQFADYAVWERNLLREGLLNHQISYWTDQLCRSPTAVVLRKPRPNASFYFRRERIDFQEDLLRQMRSFAYARAYTPFTITIATLSVLIHCQTSQREIRIGTLVANRAKRETDGLIGYLTNTVVLRLEISTAMTLDELLNNTRRVTLLAFTHAELPFEYLAQTLDAEQAPQRAFLFETLLIYQRGSLRPAETLGLKLAPLEIDQDRVEAEIAMSTLPLILRLHETSTTLTGTVDYKIDRFTDTDVMRMRKGFDIILRKMVSDSTRRVSVGSLISLLQDCSCGILGRPMAHY